MKGEVRLDANSELTFLGLQHKRETNGIVLHQKQFIDLILERHGMSEANPLSTVTMEVPGQEDPPAPEQLKELQAYAGVFNWLATRTRADIAYFTSLLASALAKHGSWSAQLSKKILRYLKGARDTGIFLPSTGHIPPCRLFTPPPP